MMRQYWDVKSQHPDALLFFRVGDFYELFDADSQVRARELDITLTSRPEPSYPNGPLSDGRGYRSERRTSTWPGWSARATRLPSAIKSVSPVRKKDQSSGR